MAMAERKTQSGVKPRTLKQNDLMWGMLEDVAAQIKWPVNGYLTFISAEDFKDLFTAALHKHNRIAAGIDGGAVILGMRTSKMSKEEMTDLIDLMLAFGANRDPQIVWTHEVKRLRELEALSLSAR